jgi:hypothetical protein
MAASNGAYEKEEHAIILRFDTSWFAIQLKSFGL